MKDQQSILHTIRSHMYLSVAKRACYRSQAPLLQHPVELPLLFVYTVDYPILHDSFSINFAFMWSNWFSDLTIKY